MESFKIGGGMLLHVSDTFHESYLGETETYTFPNSWKQRQGDFWRIEDLVWCTCNYNGSLTDITVDATTIIRSSVPGKDVQIALQELLADGEIIQTIELGKRFWEAARKKLGQMA